MTVAKIGEITEKTKIALDSHLRLSLAAANMPEEIWKMAPITLKSLVGFAPSHPDLDRVPYDVDKQIKGLNSLVSFNKPYTMCFAGDPHDEKPKLLAAFILQRWLQTKKERPYWIRMHGRFLSDSELRSAASAPFLIVSNVATNSTPNRLEMVRDLLESTALKPKIVLLAGEDPISFFYRKLYLNLNGVCMFAGKIVMAKSKNFVV